MHAPTRTEYIYVRIRPLYEYVFKVPEAWFAQLMV